LNAVKDGLTINGRVPERRRFARFVAASGVAAAVNVLSRIAFSEWLGYRWAVALAYLCGMATAFTLNKLLVFERSGKALHREIAWFCLVNAVAAAQVWGVSVGLAEYALPALGFAWHAELVAHVIGVGSVAVTSYIGHKHLSFGAAKGS
jgi:putative flippase GtrA